MGTHLLLCKMETKIPIFTRVSEEVKETAAQARHWDSHTRKIRCLNVGIRWAVSPPAPIYLSRSKNGLNVKSFQRFCLLWMAKDCGKDATRSWLKQQQIWVHTEVTQRGHRRQFTLDLAICAQNVHSDNWQSWQLVRKKQIAQALQGAAQSVVLLSPHTYVCRTNEKGYRVFCNDIPGDIQKGVSLHQPGPKWRCHDWEDSEDNSERDFLTI